MRSSPGRGPLHWLSGLIVAYLGIPLVIFAINLLRGPQRGFRTPGLYSALWVSISGATISLALISLTGIPLAFLLARSRSRLSSLVALVVQIPLALPPLMSGIILIYLVGPYTFLGRLFGGRLTNSMIGVVIAMSFVGAPFLIVAARAAFVSLDQGHLDVAATLGHSPTSRFLRTAVPLAGPGIRAGMLLAWLRAFGEYGAVVVLAYNPNSLPVYTYNQFSGVGLPTTLAPTALAMLVAVLVVLVSRIGFSGARRPRAALPAPLAPSATASEPVAFDVDHRVGSFTLRLAHEPRARNLAVLGPSGSGKSSLLRSLAGFYGADAGAVFYGAESVRHLLTEKRRVGYVAQGFSLYPHLTVWAQLLFARGADPRLAAYWLEHLHLAGLEDRYPSELSGGQRQRVALAQALCQSPRVLLLDEPFSALDMPVRRELRRELRRLQHETGLATVLVTHDPEEAAFLSDEVIVIEHGRALQSGSSREVFSRPSSPEVARLVGQSNVFRARVVSSGLIDADGVPVPAHVSDLAPGTPVLWSVRADRVSLLPASVDARADSLDGLLVDVADVGVALEYVVELASSLELRLRLSDPVELEVGGPCRVQLLAGAVSTWAGAEDATLVSEAQRADGARSAPESPRPRWWP